MRHNRWDEPVEMIFHFYDEDQYRRIDPGQGRIHHDSQFRRTWDIITCFLLMYMSLTLPVYVALDIDNEGITVIDTIIDILFIVDLVLNFFTTFEDNDKILQTDFSVIANEYLWSWFIIDFVSSINVQWMGIDSIVPREAFRMVKLLKLLKLMRVFRLGRLVGKAKSPNGIPDSDLYPN